VTTLRCQDCADAKTVSTGSTLFYLCPKDGHYRSLADVCNLIEKPSINLFLGKNVVVEAEGCVIVGRLIRYQLGSRNPHRPTVLTLKNLEGNFIIVRRWSIIKLP